MKRLVPFVEGKGDIAAVPALVARIVAHSGGYDAIILDDKAKPFQVKGIGSLLKDDAQNWRRWLKAALGRGNVGAVLLVLDGDVKKIPGTGYQCRFGTDAFCPVNAARYLLEVARQEGAGVGFSVAVVFAMQEFESWILASLDRMGGVVLTEDRAIIPNGLVYDGNPDERRDAKGQLRNLIGVYSETLDQHVLAHAIDIPIACDRSRSFRRLFHAVDELIAACRGGHHVTTPGD